MLEQAAAGHASIPAGQSEETSTFKCELCGYITNSKHGLSDHMGLKHTIKQKPEFGNLVTVDPEKVSKMLNVDNIEKSLQLLKMFIM